MFLCYTRHLSEEVQEFQAELEKDLRTFRREFRVVRDQNITSVGDDWSDTIGKAIETCDCFVVVAVPAIFESVECRREIELYTKEPMRSNICFAAVDFEDMQDALDEATRSPDAGVARMAQRLAATQRFDFVGVWQKGRQDSEYRRKVRELALQIHRKLRPAKSGLSRDRIEHVEKEVPARTGKNISRNYIVLASLFLGVALTIGSGAWVSLRRGAVPQPDKPVSWAPVDEDVELVGTIEARKKPELNVPADLRLWPGDLGKKDAPVETANISGVTWYRVKLMSQDFYFPERDGKGRITAWQPVTGRLSVLCNDTIAFKSPFVASDRAEILSRGARRPVMRRSGRVSLDKAKFNTDEWYRYSTADGYAYVRAGAVLLDHADGRLLPDCPRSP